MDKKHKTLIGKFLLDVTPTLIGSILRHFLKGGKTKLGVYLIGLSTLSIKFFFDIDTQVAAVNPAVVPAAAKVAIGTGGALLGIGIFKDVKNIL